MSEEGTSKGMRALRINNGKGVVLVEGGERFCFKKLTIQMEADLNKIVQANQDLSLKAPKEPPADAGEEALRDFSAAFLDFRQKSAEVYRRLTAEIMKYVLLEEATNNPLFNVDDDVYSLLNNVYAENFFRAYSKFRQGSEATPAAAERRFQE